jgi:group I intron endonuclease
MSKKTLSVSIVGMRFLSPPVNVVTEIFRSTPVFKREPQNAHDRNAVAVYLMGHKVGYLDKESAARVSQLMQQSVIFGITVDRISAQSIQLILKYEFTDSYMCPPVPSSINSSGIYIIKIESGKYVYIGQSNSINTRIKSHWTALASQSHANKHLQGYWNEHGMTRFTAEILEVAPFNLPKGLALQRWLADREKFWIESYRKSTTCLNILDGEIISTKKAISEFIAENAAHDNQIKEQKKLIALQISTLELKTQEKRLLLRDLEGRVKELTAFIFENTGIIGFFIGKHSKLIVNQKKEMLDTLRRELRITTDEYNVVYEKLCGLRNQHTNLKTIKQKENIFRRRLAKHGIQLKSNGQIY